MLITAPRVDKHVFQITTKYGKYFTLNIGLCQTVTLHAMRLVVAVQLIRKHDEMNGTAGYRGTTY